MAWLTEEEFDASVRYQRLRMRADGTLASFLAKDEGSQRVVIDWTLRQAMVEGLEAAEVKLAWLVALRHEMAAAHAADPERSELRPIRHPHRGRAITRL